MKEYYKINEISKLYGIGIDSLRYYERLGILKPRRDTNGYRLYSLKEFYKLSIIRDLRALDFSMQQIKGYLDGQCVQNTLQLLREEQRYLTEQQKKLKERKRGIEARIKALKAASRAEEGEITLKTLPARPCVRVNEHITRDEEMDFVIKKIHARHESRLLDFGSQPMGAFLSLSDVEKGLENVYYSVFLLLDEKAGDADFILPQGMYASMLYRGAYAQNLERIRHMLAFLKERGYEAAGDPFEFYEVDNRHTMRQSEFLTKIQLPVKLS